MSTAARIAALAIIWIVMAFGMRAIRMGSGADPRDTTPTEPSQAAPLDSSSSLTPDGSAIEQGQLDRNGLDDEGSVDLYGNEVTDAMARYKLDAGGSFYELHSPQTELPRLRPPKS